MSTTIDSLAIQISSDIGNADIKIERLAESLKKLRDNSSLTKVANGLVRLSGALTALKPAVSGLEVSKLRELSKAVENLAKIQKLSGLSSAINSLKKLPEVVDKLDTVNMTKFAVQMKKLADALKPVATSIDVVAKGFAKLPAQIKSAVSATNQMKNATGQMNNALDTSNVNLMAMISNIQSVMSSVNWVVQTMSGFLSQAIEWDGIQFRFGQSFGEDAQEVYDWIVKINEALGINIQEFMQYSGLYASLLNGFGLAQEKVTEIAVGLTELSYDIWAFSNDRFKTLEDASEAIRSAITGEIEPIRNAGIALTEASLQEYIDSTHLAGISIEKLTEAQKAEVRYAAMVNSAMGQGIIGTYAREMNTAEGAVRRLSQSIKTLTQAFGSLFIPILEKVVPYVTAFVEILTEAVFSVAKVFGIEIQALDWSNVQKGVGGVASGAENAATGLGDAAKAAKKLKDYTMGFDELNVINPDSGSGSGSGAGASGGAADWGSGLDLASLWDQALLDSATKKVDELKEKIKGYISEHKTLLSVVGSIASFLGFMKVLRGLNGLLGISKTIKNVSDAFTKLKVAAASVKIAAGNIKAFFQILKGGGRLGETLAAAFPKTANVLTAIGGALKTALTKLPSLLVKAVKAIPGWGWIAAAIIAAITGAITLAVVDKDFTDIGYKIGHALGTALSKIGDWLKTAGAWIASIGKSILDGINSAWEWVKKEFDVDNAFELILMAFNPVTLISKLVPKMIKVGAEVLPGILQGIKNGWNNFWGNIMEYINGFIDGFKDALEISSPSKVFARIGEWIVQGLLNGISDRWEAVKSWFKNTVAPKFTKEYWLDKFNALVSSAKTKLNETKKEMSDKWGDVVSWFKSNVAPKFTKDYWAKKFDFIRSATQSKLGEVKTAIRDKWGEITAWYKSSVAPKFTKDYWISKFTGLKDGFTQTIKNMVNSGIDMMNRFIGYLNSKLNFSWDALSIAGKEVYPGGSIQLFTIPNIPRLEKGGFLEDGLFTMNRGEIAGKFNNGKSVVANNEQIIAGISEGVYQAVMAAMGETQRGGEQNVNVYLDGKQIYSSIKKTEAQRGRTLMGNQLGYSY